MMLNYLFLITAIVVVVAALLYLFFWNKLVGLLLSLCFRIAFWNQGESSIWIDIGSIHISLVAGRVLFKDVRYHSSNQTFKIVKGQAVWRYWIRAPTLEEDFQANATGEGPNPKLGPQSSCRIHASLEGVEWVMYNRTAAFDNILSQMDAKYSDARARKSSMDGAASKSSVGVGADASPYPPTSQSVIVPVTTSDALRKLVYWVRDQLPNLDPKRLLPFSFQIDKGAIICGSASSLSLLHAEFAVAEGMYGNVQPRSSLDLYKQVLNIKFRNTFINFLENKNFQSSMVSTGVHLYEEMAKSHSVALHMRHYLSYQSFSRIWRHAKLNNVMTYLRDAARLRLKSQSTYHGTFGSRRKRAQSLEIETPVGQDFSKLEYAIERTILEAPSLSLSYYVDVAGTVPEDQKAFPYDSYDVGNGAVSPEWGIDLVIQGGFIRYGPWADRQRAQLQQAFFPSTYQDSDPTPHLAPGDSRLCTAMRIFVELRGGTTLYVPFREPSKNWQWDGLSKVPRPRKREGASLSVKAGDDSTISYLMPMVAGQDGYKPLLEVHLDSVTVSSSLNDIRLLTAESCRVQGDLHSPLSWNAHRVWRFNISLRQPVLYILRDHINMMTDMGKDWTTGPPSNYHTWVPITYSVDLDMRNYELNMYANDHNIIDKPLLRDENALLTFNGPLLQSEITIPSGKFRPLSTTITFDVNAPDVLVNLTLPKWSTHQLIVSEPTSKLGTVGLLRLDGSYLYFSDVRPDNVEQLRLNFIMSEVVFKCLGWSIRHFMTLRENYFGGFTHFSTIQEFLQKRERGRPMGDPIQDKWREGTSNVLNIDIQLAVDKGLIILPAGLRGYETYNPLPDQAPEDVHLGGCVLLSVPELQVQLGTHDSAMDMSLNAGTVYGNVLSNCTERELYARPPQWKPTKECFLIEGINVVADRLFGPQPHTTTYVCIWEISLEEIQGSLSFVEASIAGAALNAFSANFKDPFNAPAAEFALPLDPDVTFLKVSLGTIDLIWETVRAAVQLNMPEGLSIDMNDLAGQNYRKVTSIRIPKALCRLLQRPLGRDRWIEVAEVILDAAMDIYACPPQWQESALAQAKFLAEEDALTGRLRQLMLPLDEEGRPAFHSPNIYRGVLELPRRAPTASAVPSTHRSRPPEGNSSATKPIPFSHRAHYASDSDGEDALNDSDRDIRLANSRPPSVMPVILADNESLDTGDESDNADLTDEDRSESDWSQPADDDLSEEDAMLHQYSTVSRSFLNHRNLRPSQWWGPPFTALRDRRPLLPSRSFTQTVRHQNTGVTHAWQVQYYGDNCDTITSRVRAESVNLWLTPLLPPVMVYMLDGMHAAPRSPERRVDALLADHIKTTSSSTPDAHSKVFNVECGTTRMQLVQFIPKESKEPLSEHLHDLSPAEITTIDLFLQDLYAKGQIVEHGGEKTSSFFASLGGLEAYLGAGNRSKTGQPRYQHESVSKVSLTQVEGSMGAKRASASWGDLVVVLDHNAGHHLLDALIPYQRPIFHALDAARRWQRLAQQNGQQRLLQLLQWSSQHTVVDPLSTIQPSYLIQSGRPHSLRVSAVSKLLVHLRMCLQTMDPQKHQAICNGQTDGDMEISAEEVASLLTGQLIGMAIDADMATLSVSQLFARLFPSTDRPVYEGKASDGYPVEAVEIGYRTLRLTILDPGGGSPCHITLQCFRFSFLLQKPDLIYQSIPSNVAKDTAGGRDRPRAKYQHGSISLRLDSIDVLVLPHLLYFAQRSVSLRGRLNDLHLPSESFPRAASPSPTNTSASLETIYGEVTMSLGRLRVQVAEEKLVLVYELSHMGLASSALFKRTTNLPSRLEFSLNTSLLFDSMTFAAHSFIGRGGRNPQDILAGLSIEQGKLNGVIRQEPSYNPTIRAIIILGRLSLSVPRSVIRLLKFAEEWRADYLPAIEQTVHTLMKELQESPVSKPTTSSSASQRSTATPTIHLQLTMPSLGVSLHVMPGTWVSWELLDIISYGKSGLTSTRRSSRSFGLRVGSQRINVSAADISRPGSPTSEQLSVKLPSISVTGYHENHGMHILASVGLFQAMVKPSNWDTLLSVQQKFGQDFDDLVHVLADIRNKRPSSTRRSRRSKSHKGSAVSSMGLLHSAVLKVKGFRIGLEGRSSTALFECQDIHGGFGAGGSNTWTLTVLGMSLSLAPRANVSRRTVAFNSNHRSAFVVIDFKVKLEQKPDGEKELHIVVEKTHGVLQPSSIGEIGDFIDHLQAEVLVKQDERARALAEFKEKTKEIIRSFEGGRKEDKPKDQPPWFTKYAIKFIIRNIGAAFPLALDGKLELTRGRSHHETPVRAFLFSIKSLEFGAERNGSGQFTMESFSFQFVDRFRQSVSTDFLGDNHKTRNRMVYPEMAAQIRTEQNASSRLVRIQANVSGFILDLDPSIADHIFSLIDVYRQGKERVAKLTTNARHPIDRKPKGDSTATETQYSALPTSNIVLSLVFLSGTLRMHSSATSAPSKTSSLHELVDLRVSSSYAETFFLPVVSLWGEYRATPASQKVSGSRDFQPSTLMFKMTVHSSKNTLRPTLLPFISELVSKVEMRMRKASLRTPNTPSVTSSARDILASSPAAAVTEGENVVSSMQITFALRIDQSKLELTCQPDVNVIAGVHWDSGGFILNVSSSARQVSFMANVSGLTVGLKHGFLSEDCVRLDARNLAFSITFAKIDHGLGNNLSSVSVVLDTEVSGGMRFSRLQDVLCFKAVWLDRIPVFSADTTAEVPQKANLSSLGSSPAKQDLITIIIIRVRRIGLGADLGQSISNLRLDLEDAVFRTKLEDHVTEVSMNIGELRVSTTGNMSGRAYIPDFAFRTVRRKFVASAGTSSNSKMLELYLTSGTLDLTLESDYQKILQLWSQPLNVAVTDNWSQMSPHVSALDRSLCLNFTVAGTDMVVVATVSTIPKLMSYASRFKANLESQREGARRESEAFRIAQAPSPDNPLSAVANAMLRSARSKLKEAEDSVSHAIQQQMYFHLDSLRLVVFPRSMNDYEMAHFSARDVRAQLHRIVDADGQPVKRKLHLAFSSMSTSRISQLSHSPTEAASDVSKWLDALKKGASSATIFDLPSMDMSMDSEEVGKDGKKILEYNFYSKFVRRGGLRNQDDIFITLNVSLYSWLTLLRKNLAREMDQVQAAGDWRTSMTPATTTSPRRKTVVGDGSPPLDFASRDGVSPGFLARTPSLSVNTRPALLSSSISREHKRAYSLATFSQLVESGPNTSQGALGPPIELISPKAPPESKLPPSPVTSQASPGTATSPVAGPSKTSGIEYRHRDRVIERLNMRQLGEATPDVMHPFFMKKAGFSLEDSLPQYVHEYATMPIEQMTQALLKLYSKQLGEATDA